MLCGFAVNAIAQIDTIYTNNQAIPCEIKEVDVNFVKYVYEGESVLNSLSKNVVQKIVYRNGRIQSFAALTSLKKVISVEDYENVSIATVESEILGLFKIGDVSAKAKGTTELANQERVKARAYRKLKIVAAMMGANIIYLTSHRSRGNSMAFEIATETSITGVAYSNILPNYSKFQKLIAGKSMKQKTITYMGGSSSNYQQYEDIQPFAITTIEEHGGLIVINGQYQVTHYDETGFNIYHRTKNRWYNTRIIFE